MGITNLEVIKHNPGASTGVIAGETRELTYGDILRVHVGLLYRGRARTVTLYGAIGVRGIGFDEKIHGEASWDLPESREEYTQCNGSVDIGITGDISPGTNYDIYCKLREYPEAGLPERDDVIDIVGIPPDFDLIQDTIYPFAYLYDGDVEVVTATFKTDPFTPSGWMGETFANKLEEEVRARGGRPLEVKVYVNTVPLLWTDFRIEVVSTPISGTTGASGIAIVIPWGGILIVCLAIIAVIVAATIAFTIVMNKIRHRPGLEDVKPAWGKETLILAIQDSEEYWERTPTPEETLRGMTEEELREYLDKIAEEEISKEVDWLPLAIIGGLGVLGVGAAFALVAGRR